MLGGTIAVEAAAPSAGLDYGPSAKADREPQSARASWLLCRAGTRLHAIPIEHVIEIMRVLPIEAISGAPRYVRGLCIIRGAPVPVVDIGLLIGGEATPFERLVTIRTGARTIALAVESVSGIRNVGADAFDRLPPLLENAANETIDAIGTRAAELLFFLRTARRVPEDLFDRLDVNGSSS